MAEGTSSISRNMNYMNEDKLYDLQNKIGEALLAFGDVIKELCESLSDEEIRELADAYYADAKPNDTHNFPMPIYEEIASKVEAELYMRNIFKKAEEYMKVTGEKFYCVACDGACQGHE